MTSETKEIDDELRFDLLFRPVDAQSRERLVSLGYMRTAALAGNRTHSESRRSKKAVRGGRHYREQLNYAVLFSSLYSFVMKTDDDFGTSNTQPPLEFRREHVKCKDMQFEMLCATVDAATSYIAYVNETDNLRSPKVQIQTSVFNIIDNLLDADERKTLFLDGRRVVGLLNMCVHSVFRSWLTCPRPFIEDSLFRPPNLQRYATWIRAYLCYSYAMQQWDTDSCNSVPDGKLVDTSIRYLLTSRKLLSACDASVTLCDRCPVPVGGGKREVVQANQSRLDIPLVIPRDTKVRMVECGSELIPWYDAIQWLFLLSHAHALLRNDLHVTARIFLYIARFNDCPFGVEELWEMSEDDSLYAMAARDLQPDEQQSCATAYRMFLDNYPMADASQSFETGVSMPDATQSINLKIDT